MADLESALQHLLAAKRISAPSQSYRKDNPNEYAKVKAYLDGGARPTGVTTEMGLGLVEVEDVRRNVTPPPPGTVIPSDGVIRQGGTYTGTASGQLSIQTAAPVVLLVCSLTYAAGTMIRTSTSFPPDLTLERCSITGGAHRILDCDAFKRIAMLNCSIEKTAGITLVGNGDVSILRNRHHNIQRVPGGVGNFVQLRHLQTGTVEVAWNEIVNEYNLSDPEDVFSIYHSSGTWFHDNMIWGQFHPGNGTGSSQNTITLDSYNAAGGIPTNNNRIERNQVVKALSISVFPKDAPANGNLFLENRVVSSGLLTDNVTKNRYGLTGIHVISGGINNHAHGNVLGYMSGTNHGGGRNDGMFEGTPEGDASEWTRNTHLAPHPGTITPAHEQAEWDLWLAKVAAAGVTIGL